MRKLCIASIDFFFKCSRPCFLLSSTSFHVESKASAVCAQATCNFLWVQKVNGSFQLQVTMQNVLYWKWLVGSPTLSLAKLLKLKLLEAILQRLEINNMKLKVNSSYVNPPSDEPVKQNNSSLSLLLKLCDHIFNCYLEI